MPCDERSVARRLGNRFTLLGVHRGATAQFLTPLSKRVQPHFDGAVGRPVAFRSSVAAEGPDRENTWSTSAGAGG